MALGKRPTRRQEELLVPVTQMPRSPGHPFYQRLNDLLRAAGFDQWTEDLCAEYYAASGRPSIPPGVYFRMLLIGYFEGIESQRGIAWRCADSRSLQEFLGLGQTDRSPEHSSLTRVRQRLPLAVHEEVFAFIVKIAKTKGLLKGKRIAVDTTTLEANAAMKSIVRKDTGKDWTAFVRGLAEEAGIADPSDDDLRRFDRGRKNKKVPNKDWESPSDPDARIGKMKDGRTELSYKAQHAVDLDTDLLLAATIHFADESDAELLKDAVAQVTGVLSAAGHDGQCEEVAADKGYHKTESLAWLAERGIRSYIPERRSSRKRRWDNKPAGWKAAFVNNRTRVGRRYSALLQRKRSEMAERSFAHTCRTGRARRTWIRGREEVGKRYAIHAAARNLGRIMRALFGCGTPRGSAARNALCRLWRRLCRSVRTARRVTFSPLRTSSGKPRLLLRRLFGGLRPINSAFSTAC